MLFPCMTVHNVKVTILHSKIYTFAFFLTVSENKEVRPKKASNDIVLEVRLNGEFESLFQKFLF